MRIHPVVAVGLVVLAALFLGSCAFDYVAATPQLEHVTVVSKAYRPGYYRQECSTDGDDRRQKCRQVWQSPEWSVRFSGAEGGDTLNVVEDTFDRLQTGDEKWLSYRRGAFWRLRYATMILDRPPDPESGK